MSNGFIVKSKYNDSIVDTINACHEAGITPILWGEPGLGKTALIEALSARDGDSHFDKVLANSMDPTDIVGMPIRYETEPGEWVTDYAPPGWAVRANKAEKATVFFDEMSTGDQSVQASLLTLLHSRHIPMGPKVKDSVRFIAAANPAEIASNGFVFTPALANRLVHIEWSPPIQDWFVGMLQAWGAESVSDQEVKTRGLIVAYLKQNESFVQKMPTDPESAGGAWPSRRSWDNLAKTLPRVSHLEGRYQEDLMKGVVGLEAAIGFKVWMDGFTLPEPSDVLDDPSIVDWRNDSSDKTYAVLASIIAHGSKSRGEDCVDVFIYAAANGPVDVPSALVLDLLSSGYKSPDGKFPVRLLAPFRETLTQSGVYA